MNNDNAVLASLEAIPKLIDGAIRLIKEGEANRLRFFEVHVKPVHIACNILYDAHLKTLQEVLSASREKDKTQVTQIINDAVLFEQRNTNRLAIAVNQADLSRARGQLGDLFYFYIFCVGKILIQPKDFQYSRNTNSIFLYAGLEELVELSLVTPERVSDLVLSLNKWNERVLSSYNELRIYCHA